MITVVLDELKTSSKNIYKALRNGLLRRHYAILLCLLIVTLSLPPLITALGWRTKLIELLLFVSLVSAVLGAATRKQRKLFLLTLVCAGLLLVAGRILKVEAASNIAGLTWICLAVIAAVRAVRFALDGSKINSEHICAALSAYMLVGHFYGLSYWRVENTWPGSFAFANAAALPGQFDLQTSIYFSFVTIATLGYGDITPLSAVARGFAVTEAVLGQFYMAVLVARLVGVYASRALESKG